MNQLTKVFEGQELRILGNEDNPQFLLNDVCKILGLSNSRMVKERLADDVSSTYPIKDALGRTQQATFINEDGLYDVVLESRKPEAKKFRKWITSEVIPSIRKHGGYLTPDKVEEVLLNPDTLIKLATNLKEERLRRRQAEQVIESQKGQVLFANAVESSESSILVGELAKLISQNGVNIGQNRLFEWLRENGFLIKKKGELYNLPTQYSIDLDLMDIKKRVINNADGSSRVTRTTKITGKGQIYFINKFLEVAAQ